jgi:putative membrane protein
MKRILRLSMFTAMCILAIGFSPLSAATPSEPLNDLEIAHSAYTADTIDIRYAKIALEKSQNPQIREFAELMIRDHTAVNDGAGALLKKLGVTAKDNEFSQTLNKGADAKVAEFHKLSGSEFDKAYAANELGYHQVVNKTVGGWIPTIKTSELQEFMKSALVTFKVHEEHAGLMVKTLEAKPK